VIASRNMLNIIYLRDFLRKCGENIGLSPTIAPTSAKWARFSMGFPKLYR